jgi:hypothetical protein
MMMNSWSPVNPFAGVCLTPDTLTHVLPLSELGEARGT